MWNQCIINQENSLNYLLPALIAIKQEAEDNPDIIRNAPHTLPATRLDDMRAAKELDLAWQSNKKA